jgi:DNA polymerase I
MSESRLLLVDGHAYAYRSFHAIRSLNAPDGSPTNALFGFIKALQKLIACTTPTHVLVVWDGGLDSARMVDLPDYKANRAPTPDALDVQLPQLAQWLDAAGWPQLQREGTEADDWIGTYATLAAQAGWSVVIASPDKDFLQLVNDRIGIFNPNDKTEKIWTPADVEAKTGVLPHLIADWLALIGDSVDNIPGVPGVGPKTATDLLKKYGSAEAAIAAAPSIKAEKLRTELMAASETLRRNQRMVRLKCDLPDGPPLEASAPRPRDVATLRDMYRRWGFRGLLSELGEAPAAPVQGDLF